MQPLIAVAGIPDLPSALRSAGFSMLTEETSPPLVARSARALAPDQPLIVIAAWPDPTLASWLGLQASQGRFVVVLGDDPHIAHVRHLELPATVNEVMALFRAPTSDAPAGQALIGADYTVGGLDTPAPQPAPEAAYYDPYLDEFPEPPAAHQTATTTVPAAVDAGGLEVVPATFADLPIHAPTGASVLEEEPGTGRGEVTPLSYRERPQAAIAFDEDPAAAVSEPVQVPGTDGGPAAAPYSDPYADDDDLAGLVAGPIGGNRVTRTLGLAPVVIVFAAKGGVGKTSFSLTLAERAVEVGSLSRVVVVDGNRGQGDVRKYLRLSTANLPTMYDSALSGNPKQAIIGPRYLQQHRDPRLPDLGFGVVMAPRNGQTDRSVVTEAAYSAVVEEARRFADLVIVDTQILEDTDTSGLWDGLWLPLLRSGGWGVAMSDGSTAGVSNLLDRLRQFTSRGLGPDRVMIGLNKLDPESTLDLAETQRRLERYGTFIGAVHESASVKQAFESGRLPIDAPGLAGCLDAALYRVTGLAALDPARPDGPHDPRHTAGQGAAGGGGFWAGLWGRFAR